MRYATAMFGEHFAHTRCYVIGCSRTGSAVVVDPGQHSVDWVHAQIRGHDFHVRIVLLTHGHMDHTWDAQPLADQLGATVLLAAAGHRYLRDPDAALPADFPKQLLAGHPRQLPVRLRTPPKSFQVGTMTIRTLATPGHTPCSVSYLIESPDGRLLCTGDTLLGGGQPGSPVPPGGDQENLATSIAQLTEAVTGAKVLPGHGRPFAGQVCNTDNEPQGSGRTAGAP